MTTDAEWFGLLESLADVQVRFWQCPIREHAERKTVTVEWQGDVAHCTAPGCGNTNAAPVDGSPDHGGNDD